MGCGGTECSSSHAYGRELGGPYATLDSPAVSDAPQAVVAASSAPARSVPPGRGSKAKYEQSDDCRIEKRTDGGRCFHWGRVIHLDTVYGNGGSGAKRRWR